MNSLIKKYPDWIIEDTTGISHEADIYAYSSKYGKILYEIKDMTIMNPIDEVLAALDVDVAQ